MSHRVHIFLVLAIALGLLAPDTVAQKPPAPAPPPSTPPSRPATPSPLSSEPSQPREDLVMFLLGRVATHDGALSSTLAATAPRKMGWLARIRSWEFHDAS